VKFWFRLGVTQIIIRLSLSPAMNLSRLSIAPPYNKKYHEKVFNVYCLCDPINWWLLAQELKTADVPTIVKFALMKNSPRQIKFPEKREWKL